MKKNSGMTRREFFAAGAGLAGVTVLSSGASRGFAAGPAAKTRVVLVRTDSRADGVKKCLELLKIDPFKGRDVLVKPNFNTSDEAPGSTHAGTVLDEALALAATIASRGPLAVAAAKKDVLVDLFGVAWLPFYQVQVGTQAIELPGFSALSAQTNL